MITPQQFKQERQTDHFAHRSSLGYARRSF